MSYPKLAILGLSHGYKFVKQLQKCSFAKLVAVADLSIETALKSYSINESEVNEKSKLLDVTAGITPFHCMLILVFFNSVILFL